MSHDDVVREVAEEGFLRGPPMQCHRVSLSGPLAAISTDLELGVLWPCGWSERCARGCRRSRGPIWLKVATVTKRAERWMPQALVAAEGPWNVSRRHRPSEHHRRSMTVLREANRQAWTTWRWRDLHAPRGNGLGCLATTTAPIRHSFCGPASRCTKSPQAPPVSCSSAGRWCHDRSAVGGGADPVRQPWVD